MNPDVEAELDQLAAMPDEAFRTEVRTWIANNYPDAIRNAPKRLHWHENKPWFDKLAAKGWLAPAWPREHGGMGISAAKQLIMVEETERYGCARISDIGMILLGPLLIRYGTPEQRARFLPPMLTGEHIWSQGYSEPGAGSDLASLRTEAVADGDEWVVNGQKTWTTLGMDANWIFLLVRTDKTARKQEGISFLLVPMDSPGITVRPIVNLDLHDEFAEVFLDDVRVPRDNLVGGVNQGWTMAKALLGFERLYIGSARQSAYALGRLRVLADRMGVSGEPAFEDEFRRLRCDLEDHKALFGVFAEQVRRGDQLGADVSLLKVHQTELYQRITDKMLEVGAEYAGLLDPVDGNRELHPAGLFLQARPTTIYGGSSEIQRNILARNLLELPA